MSADLSPEQLFDRADDAICALAVCAVPGPLAAGASDSECGSAVRADLVAHGVAAMHRFMLRLTARGNDLVDWARERDQSNGTASTKADLAAARVAASSGRLLESCRHGLTALARLRPAAEEVVFQTVTWSAGTVPDEEVKRRLAEARAKAAEQGETKPMSARAQQVRADALLEAHIIAEEARVRDLCEIAAGTRPGWGLTFLSRLFGHQIAAGHGLAVRLVGGADRALDRSTDEGEEPAASLTLANASARLLDRVRRGVLALDKIGQGPKGGPKKIHPVWIGIDPKDIPVDAPANTNDAGTPSAEPQAPAAKLYATPTQARGKLKNGNPSGDYLAAPRCGACTRAGTACRQPAMQNGRCRFHGGKSTGPRTAQGLARARTARLTHGGYSAEIIDLQKAAAAYRRQFNRVVAGLTPRPLSTDNCELTTVPAGHGVDPFKPRNAA